MTVVKFQDTGYKFPFRAIALNGNSIVFESFLGKVPAVVKIQV